MTASYLETNTGTGFKLAVNQYTEAGQTVNDQKMMVGEPYLPTYCANTSNTGPVSCATASSHLLQIMAGASLRVRIRRITIYQQAAATTAAIGQIHINRLTTAGTGGASPGAPLTHDSNDGASGATAMTLPTVKGTEGAYLFAASVYFMQTIAASAMLNAPLLDLDFDRIRSEPIIISAGATNGIAVRMTSAIAAASVNINVLFQETSW